MVLCFLVFGVALNAPILLAGEESENHKHSKSWLTGSFTDEFELEEEIKIDEDDDEKRIRRKIKIKRNGEEFEFESRLRIEKSGSELEAFSSEGKRHRIRIDPEKAKLKIREKWKRNLNISNVSLEEVRHKNVPKVVYKLQSDHPGRFLGIFKMILKIQSQVDPETGEILATKIPWWAFLLADLEIPDDLPTGNEDNETDDDSDDDEEENETEDENGNETDDDLNETNSTA